MNDGYDKDIDRDLEDLLGGVSPRREPPEEVRQRVFQAVDQAWRQHKRRRWRLPLALAAAALLAGLTALLVTSPGPDVKVEIAQGEGIWVNGVLEPAGKSVSLAPGTRVEARGSVRLLTDDGLEVRLRDGTQLTWLASLEVDLARGSLYVVTDGGASMRVHTRMGIVRDIGTIFMVTLDETALEVAIRDGKVIVETALGDYRASARGLQGDVVKVDAQRIVAGRAPASADRWAWIYDVHPGYEQNRVSTLLGAIAEDLGLALEFASPAAEAHARAGRLVGSLEGLAPAEALDVVLATTGLERRANESERLIVALPAEGNRE